MTKEKEQTTLQMPVELLSKLREESIEKGYTVTEVVQSILWAYFENNVQE